MSIQFFNTFLPVKRKRLTFAYDKYLEAFFEEWMFEIRTIFILKYNYTV